MHADFFLWRNRKLDYSRLLPFDDVDSVITFVCPLQEITEYRVMMNSVPASWREIIALYGTHTRGAWTLKKDF